MGAGDLWLLIGNSRWHWVEALAEAASDPGSPVLRFSHSPPPPDPALLPWERLRAWAAVGPVPFQGRENTCQLAPMEGRRLQLEQVPLQQLPPWLGIDRALVGWQAWQRQGRLGRGAVLVADAGTALSLTRIGATGAFAGGRLQPGVSTQLSCLGRVTELLPLLVPGPEGLDHLAEAIDPWPIETEQAMRVGCLLGLSAAVAQAWRDLQPLEPTALWLTGGDAPSLAPLLRREQVPFKLAPELALEALVALSSDPDPRGSAGPSPRP
ncbi:type III pantothenate kinase [Synechococcus sp. CBW1107]|uniref:type III pantothenate kinase n=1 Tax=Synechococcus sp. CBW1107 TaxID=2789857 RepID=UPI002AD2870E|nr:type III pantothenate kinase [Synechococcus sp. CBW1107]CAK6692966.1 Type III pantothenate kinase [Synechococcus sp. CBW1107]